jgi:MOB kinase activator 1
VHDEDLACNEQGEALKQHVDATLGRGNVYEAVKLPEGEDIREWLAVNTVDLYNAISVLYMTLVEYCTDETCKTMSAGSKVWSSRWLVALCLVS